ncbi:MAG TPA: DUF6081 family protein [Candidatus Bathyarchaeia archaeon]|nr:DUF6081 family protein [Candidatus Bathyarchaeia archaeon]
MIFAKDNFSTGKFDAGNVCGEKPWFFYEQPGFLGRDPNSQLNVKDNKLTINTSQYSLTTPGVHDHVKFLFFRNVTNKETGLPGFKTPEKGELYTEMNLAFEAYGTEKNPFGMSADDYRLSAGLTVCIDYDTFMVYDFYVSKTKAHIVYERLPFDQKVNDPAAFFIYVIPIKDIEPGSTHTYRTTYNKSKYTLTWCIDGKKVFSLNEFGRRLNKDYEQYIAFKDQPGSKNPDTLPLVKSSQRIFGAGLFTLLDAGTRFDKGLVDIHDPDTPKEKKLFGQGGKLTISDFEVGTN